MKTLLIGGQKGGTGKSCAAANISVWLAGQGVDVLLLDADAQKTSTKFVARRLALNVEAPLARVHCMQASGDVSAAITDAAGRYQVVIIDTPGADSVELRSALLVCESFISPSQASISDLETLGDLSAVVERSKMYNRGLRSYVLISKAPTNPQIREVESARELLADFRGFELLDTVIRERKVYRDAALAGRGVVEMDNAQAKAEVQLLCQSLFPELTTANI